MEKTFNTQYSDGFNAAKKALKVLGFTLEYSDKKSGLIQASSSSSFLSWGEDIQIKISEINFEKTKIEVRSSSKAQLISWGKNSTNEEDIIQEIKNILR